jgi:hypothetical protein
MVASSPFSLFCPQHTPPVKVCLRSYKKRAANWTAKEFPQWSTLIENALKWREDWRSNQVDAEETLPEIKQFVHFILDQINI